LPFFYYPGAGKPAPLFFYCLPRALGGGKGRSNKTIYQNSDLFQQLLCPEGLARIATRKKNPAAYQQNSPL